ncbi:MAG: hypothetical protein L0338_25275 [Acidobacteria bacterium]|nr:hypothetical protein [Acidobacteriota bacterium]
MSAQSMTNLDRLCAQSGWEIAKQVQDTLGKGAENHITKSLGVLQEDGVYAFFLYQASRKREKDGADKLGEQSAKLLSEKTDLLPKGTTSAQQALKEIRDGQLADDLDQLLLAKRLLEQTLIYARYHAKALEE